MQERVFGLPGLRSDKLVLLLLKMQSHVQDRDDEEDRNSL